MKYIKNREIEIEYINIGRAYKLSKTIRILGLTIQFKPNQMSNLKSFSMRFTNGFQERLACLSNTEQRALRESIYGTDFGFWLLAFD